MKKTRSLLPLLGVLCLVSTLFLRLLANTPAFTPPTSGNSTDSVKTSRVYLLESDSLLFNEAINPDAKLIYGSQVKFRHDSIYLFCDSAYFYEKNNTLEAFSNVRIEQGDTLFLYGDYLIYDGNTQLAQVRENVKMENKQVTLLTDSLDYDRMANLAYYFNGGIISDTANVLTSINGVYNPATKIAIFQDSVKLENEKFVLTTDTLEYNTETTVATIVAQTLIDADSTTIHTSRGWYNTTIEDCVLLDRSIIVNKTQEVVGDSMVYNRLEGLGEIYGAIEMIDTLHSMKLTGEYAYYNEKDSVSFVTDSALFIQYNKQDTLYLHADTLRSRPDSTYKIIQAYYGVRFFRTSGQGVCDSMEYRSRDSILHMYTLPILWGNDNQLTGDTISVFMNDSTIDYAHIRPLAFSVQQMGDSTGHNQMSGSDMKAYFEDGNIRKIDVSGNVETIFYPMEKDSTIVGMNKAVSSYLTIWIKNQKLEKLIMWPSPEGTLTPLDMLDPETTRLKGFKWFGHLRPTSPEDVFRKVRRTGEGEETNRRRRRRQ